MLEIGAMRLEVLYPAALSPYHGNNISLVIRAIHGETGILFTGDIEREAEAAILAAGIDIAADVLKVAHHGSRTSTTPEFLAAVSPDLAVISAGRGNMFNHPHPSTLRTLEGQGVQVMVTADAGAVLLRTDGRGFRIRTMR